jgi:hypothetical protein
MSEEFAPSFSSVMQVCFRRYLTVRPRSSEGRESTRFDSFFYAARKSPPQ